MELEELVTRASNGDNQALNQLYNDTYRQAYQVAMQMFHDENEAFDILQDSYIKAFNNLSNLKEPSKFKSWFFQIVSNTCRDYLRKRKNNPMFFSDMTYEDDNGENEIEFVDESTAFSPEENVDYSETQRLVAEMIDNLPDEQRLVLLMYYIEGLSIKEIAQSLEVSENTVKSRMNYGKKKLKVQVEELEKKGTKLYGIAGLGLFGFIVWMFRNNAQNISVPDMSKVVAASFGKAPLTDTVNSQNAGSPSRNAQPNTQAPPNNPATPNAGNVANATASVAKKASKHIASKVIGGIVAVSVAGTATAAVISPEFRKSIDVLGLFADPKDTVEMYEKALNDCDYIKIAECYSPIKQSLLKLAFANLNAMGKLSGNEDELLTEVAGNMVKEARNGKTFDLVVKDAEYSGFSDSATLTVNVTYGKNIEYGTVDFYMKKVWGKWYIDDMRKSN